ncbi:MAG: hypothetical protein IIA87_00605 [Nanoarchaeota archaeon]|nr:hypothetical protein [Nanoarchaeota archaeon]
MVGDHDIGCPISIHEAVYTGSYVCFRDGNRNLSIPVNDCSLEYLSPVSSSYFDHASGAFRDRTYPEARAIAIERGASIIARSPRGGPTPSGNYPLFKWVDRETESAVEEREPFEERVPVEVFALA